MAERNLRKTRVGKVVSNKMDKTIVVAIQDNVLWVKRYFQCLCGYILRIWYFC